MHFKAASIDEIIPSDVIQHILSFQIFNLKNLKQTFFFSREARRKIRTKKKQTNRKQTTAENKQQKKQTTTTLREV